MKSLKRKDSCTFKREISLDNQERIYPAQAWRGQRQQDCPGPSAEAGTILGPALVVGLFVLCGCHRARAAKETVPVPLADPETKLNGGWSEFKTAGRISEDRTT